MASSVLLSGMTLISTSPAEASTRVAGKAMNATYMGIEKVSGKRFICLDNGRATPQRLGKAHKIKDATTAYLLHKYGKTNSDKTAAALSYIVKTDSKLPHSHKSKTPSANSIYSGLSSTVSKMKSEAKKYAGDYKISPKVTTSSNDKTGTVSGVGIKASSGKYVSGTKITLSLTGNATFSDNKKTKTLTSGSSAKSYSIKRTGSGAKKDTIKVSAKTGALSTSYVLKRDHDRSGGQAIVEAEQATSAISGSASAAFDALFDYTITTKAAHLEDGPGNTRLAKDALTLKVTRGSFPKGAKVVVNSTLWNNGAKKPARQNSVPSSAKKVGSTSTTFTAAGTKNTANITVPANTGTDWFTWTDSVAATSVIPSHRSQYGVASETLGTAINEREFSPVVSTQTNKPDTDGNISDVYTIKAGASDSAQWGKYVDDADGSTKNVPIKVTLDLYTSNINPTTQKGDSTPKDAKHICTLKTKAYTAPAANETSDKCNVGKDFKGYTVWVESIKEEDTPANQGRDLVNSFDGDYGVASETNLIKWTPNVKTQVQSQEVRAGDTLSDKLTVTGLPSKPNNLTATCTVWGPMATKPKNNGTLPEGVEKFDEGTVKVTGNGEFTCDTDRKVEKSGYYTFTESLSGNDEVTEHKDDKTYTEETTLNKWKPAVTTKTQDKVVNPGDELTDILTISGLEDQGQPGPKGTATCTVWGPSNEPMKEGNEIGPDEKPFSSGTVEVNGNGDYKCTAEKPADKGGYYTFTEKFTPSEDDKTTTDSHESRVVRAEETLLTRYVPTVTTKATKETVELKDGKAEISDHLVLSDGKPGQEYSVASCVNGPAAELLKEGQDTPSRFNGECKVVKIKAGDDGKGEATSPEFTVKKKGNYWFTYKGDETETSKKFTDNTFHKVETTVVTTPPETPPTTPPTHDTPKPGGHTEKKAGHKASTGGENNEGVNPLVIGGGALVLLGLAGTGAYVVRRNKKQN